MTMMEKSARGGWFPLFFPLEGRPVTVLGGGKIALRRIRSLLPTGCCLRVIAPEGPRELEDLSREGKLRWEKRPYAPGDCEGAFLVLACTGDPAVQQEAAEECRRLGIPVNRADRREDCDFYFPGIARKGPVVAGITAAGENHALARRAGDAVRRALEELTEEED